MKRIASLFALLATSTSLLMAQSGNLEVKGSVFDFGSAEPLYPAAIQVYSLPDSTYVNGSSTDENGAFLITGLKAGNYVSKVTFMGYIETEKSFTLRSNSRSTDIGKITMKADAKMINEVVVNASLAKVQMINDTVVFNGEAYKLPEGSSLEDLVRKLPGVQIGSDGQIKVNGKAVSKILVNGKEFFDNNQSVALQNLTADMVEKIKSYDKQSDFARQTGIDDGEEQTVLDLTVKKGMAQGWFGNASVGYGQPLQETIFDVEDLYNVSLTLNRFAEDRQFTVIASAGQTAGGAGGGGGMMGGGVGGFGGGRGMGGMGGGLSKNYQAGINFARNLGREVTSDSYQYEIGGSVNFSSGDSESQSKTSSESFYTGGTHTYSNRESNSNSENYNLNGQLRFEWNYDEKTSLIFTPSVTYSKSSSNSDNDSKTFVNDPYQWVTNPLDSNTVYTKLVFDSPIDEQIYKDSIKKVYLESIWNSQNSLSNSESENMSTSGNIQFVKRLGDNGRNVSFRGTYSFSNSTSKQYSRNDQSNRQMNMLTGTMGPNNQTLLNRFNDTPNESTSLSGQVSYTEPVGANTFLQFSYNVSYSNSNSDRITYDFDNTWAGYNAWGQPGEQPDWILEDGYLNYEDSSLSQYTTRKNINHTLQIQIRKVADKYNLNAGISILPQYQSVIQDYMLEHTDLSRTVYNWTPTVNLTYRWTRQEQIRFQYRGSSSQPDMNDLIEVVDNSNPLSVTTGNAGLDPTFRNNLSLNYQKYNPVTLGSLMGGISFNNTLRSIVRKTTLKENGGTLTRPENMEGAFSNWSASGNVNLSKSLTDQRFTFNSTSSVSYNHQEGWASVVGKESQLRTSLTTGLNENLSASFRDDWVNVELQGRIGYNHSTNDLQPDRNMDTYDFSYGPSVTATLPWRNIRLASDLQMSSRRGYSSEDMNTDELIWNASASISFLPGNKGTISLAVYDILQERSNVSRQVSATMRSDTYNNTISNYFMATFIYRLQMFGDKEARQSMRGRGGFSGGMGGMGGMGGGFGGGMGGGGGFGGGMGGF